MKRLPIGFKVRITERGPLDGLSAVVRRHGRDMNGPYTEVELADGTLERFHRACLDPIPAPCSPLDAGPL